MRGLRKRIVIDGFGVWVGGVAGVVTGGPAGMKTEMVVSGFVFVVLGLEDWISSEEGWLAEVGALRMERRSGRNVDGFIVSGARWSGLMGSWVGRLVES